MTADGAVQKEVVTIDDATVIVIIGSRLEDIGECIVFNIGILRAGRIERAQSRRSIPGMDTATVDEFDTA